MPVFPIMPVYLFYGTQPDKILQARDAVLNMLLLPETRDESLTEYYSTTNTATVKLADLLDEIAGDLATVSFFPDARKCVVVTNPAELFAASATSRRPSAKKTKAAAAAPAKKSPEERIADWIANELPQTGHHLILLAFEDESDAREVQDKSDLYMAILRAGQAQAFRDGKAFFRIEESLVARDPKGCLMAVSDLWKTGKGDQAVYNSVVRALRYLMQANIAREKHALRDPDLQNRLFPADKQRSLFQAHPNVQRKYLGGPVYRTADLLKAYEGTLEVYRALRPRPGDAYVPDALGLLTQTLAQLFASPRPPIR